MKGCSQPIIPDAPSHHGAPVVVRLRDRAEWPWRDSPWESSGVEEVRTPREKGSEPSITDDRRKSPPDGAADPVPNDLVRNAGYFVDAAHFVFAPFLGCLWCAARLFVRAASGRKRYNVLGALD